MKISKRKNAFTRTSTPERMLMPMLLDEFHALAPRGECARIHFGSNNPPAMIATQAIITRKGGGKRTRFISTMTWANGEPLKPAKQKFLPAQCLRRQALMRGRAGIMPISV